jgi:NAD(P)-dependent dehydrogenase (short-subunit alcohol dehydrogenase family)
MTAILESRVALVTGAGNGIGKAITHTLSQNGAAVVLVDIDIESTEEAARETQAWDGNALAIKCDVSDPTQVQQAVHAAVEKYNALHILVNNAGISPLRSIEQISLEEWNRVMAVNLTGPFLFCQAALPYLRQAGSKGRIINIGSLAGQTGGIAVGAHYAASKGGLMVLTRQLAKLLAPDRVTANNISPGTTDTQLTQAWGEDTLKALIGQIPLGRLGTPQDVASLALFLASDDAGFITGATFNVNGGMFIG